VWLSCGRSWPGPYLLKKRSRILFAPCASSAGGSRRACPRPTPPPSDGMSPRRCSLHPQAIFHHLRVRCPELPPSEHTLRDVSFCPERVYALTADPPRGVFWLSPEEMSLDYRTRKGSARRRGRKAPLSSRFRAFVVRPGHRQLTGGTHATACLTATLLYCTCSCCKSSLLHPGGGTGGFSVGPARQEFPTG